MPNAHTFVLFHQLFRIIFYDKLEGDQFTYHANSATKHVWSLPETCFWGRPGVISCSVSGLSRPLMWIDPSDGSRTKM